MRIASKISISILATIVILSSLAAVLIYAIAKNSLETSIYNGLRTVAVSRTNHIHTYLGMLKAPVTQLSQTDIIEDFLDAKLQNGSASSDISQQVMKNLEKAKSASPSISELMLLDAAGTVVASTDNRFIGSDKSKDKCFLNGQNSTYIRDAYYSEVHKEPMMSVSVPLICRHNHGVSGVIVAEVELDELNAIVTDRTGLGDTGEIYIVNEHGYMITPSRFIEDAVLKQKVNTENTRMAMLHKAGQHVLQDEQMKKVFPDYRNVPVIGAHEVIPRMKWSVLAEIDADEAFAPLARLHMTLLLVLLVMVVVALLSSVYVAKSITAPLCKLHRGTEIISSGNFDYKVGIDNSDEVGRLACAFDAMAENLKNTTTSVERLNVEIAERRRAEEDLSQMLAWQRGIGDLQQSLLVPASFEAKLKSITDAIVEFFDADFCRIWIIQPGDTCDDCIHAEAKEGPHVCRHRDKCLHLLASSGRYTHIDGTTHKRVPFGCYKIGLVASGTDLRFLTNDASNDPRVHNNQWARELGLKAFAGYQLRVPGGSVLGVLALFAKHQISSAEDAMLNGISNSVSFVIQQAISDEALRESKAELESAVEKLELANSELKDFVYIASHDLREPARKISSFGALLNNSLAGKLEDDDQENISFMIDGANRMQQMMDSLLVYSRVTTKGAEFQSVDLNEVIERVKEFELAVKLEETGGIIDVPETLPTISGDPTQITQLIQNLIGNALKYQRKGATPEVTIRAREQEGDMVRIEVEDNGIGIKENECEKVFAMFSRLHSRQEYEGTGIGLAVCKKIVERHGGKISVRSTYGKGSTFVFALPKREVHHGVWGEFVSALET